MQITSVLSLAALLLGAEASKKDKIPTVDCNTRHYPATITSAFFNGGNGSWYTELCGQIENAQYVAAVPDNAWGNGSHYCGQRVAIFNEYRSKTETIYATVVDVIEKVGRDRIFVTREAFNSLFDTTDEQTPMWTKKFVLWYMATGCDTTWQGGYWRPH